MDFKSLLQTMDNISENTVHKAGVANVVKTAKT